MRSISLLKSGGNCSSYIDNASSSVSTPYRQCSSVSTLSLKKKISKKKTNIVIFFSRCLKRYHIITLDLNHEVENILHASQDNF